MTSQPNYPARVKSIRRKLGLTQTEMAERIGVSFATINRWENGQTRPMPLAWEQITQLETRNRKGNHR